MENENIEENVTSENIEEVETTEEVEDTDEGQEDEVSNSPTLEDFEKAQAKLKELEEKNKQLYARIKKSEEQKTNKKTNTNISDEESLLRLAKVAGSLDDEDLEVLKSINGSSIAEKVDNPLFKAFKAEKERKLKQSKSALSPSTPGRTFNKQDPNDQTISPEEREARIKKTMGI
jgi:hypothetical protein